jgi:hypothetical protein
MLTLLPPSDPRLHTSCELLSVSVGTAFRILRDPGLCSPLGSGAGRILIAGCSDKLRDSLAKNAWRSGDND